MSIPESEIDRLPSRLTEKAFRRYEDVIHQAVDSYPICVAFEPTGSISTFTARLRDAILSLYRYEWSTKIDTVKFRNIYNDLVVSHQLNKVVIGSSKLIKATGVSGPTYFGYTAAPLDAIRLKSTEHARFICELASKQMLAVAVRVTGIDDENVEYLEMNYDVSITKNPDGSYTII